MTTIESTSLLVHYLCNPLHGHLPTDCWHAHRENEEFFPLTGQLAQPKRGSFFSKRAAFFDSLESKVGHIMPSAATMLASDRLSACWARRSRTRSNRTSAPVRREAAERCRREAVRAVDRCHCGMTSGRSSCSTLSSLLIRPPTPQRVFLPIAHRGVRGAHSICRPIIIAALLQRLLCRALRGGARAVFMCAGVQAVCGNVRGCEGCSAAR